MTLGLDYVVWEMDPVGYHLTNVVLHTATAIVLYFLARRVLRAASSNAGEEPSAGGSADITLRVA